MEVRRSQSTYRLLRRLARGGMGEVHLACLEAPGGVRRLVAIKMALEASPATQAALFAEARLAALLVHPNIAQLLDAGLEGERAWFAMEFVDGLSLAELCAAGGPKLPVWTWVRIFADACAALHAVHEARDEQGGSLNIVHRDITPQNLLVGWNGVVKLVDFGIARSALRGSVTTTGIVRGKVGYLSPEQASGDPVDRRSDVFALGVLFWEAIAGRRLFSRETENESLAAILRGDVPALSEVRPEVPAALSAIAARALQTSAAARFATALEMERALEGALQEGGVMIGSAEVAHVLSCVAGERASLTRPTESTERPESKLSGPGLAATGSRPLGGHAASSALAGARSRGQAPASRWRNLAVGALALGGVSLVTAAWIGKPQGPAQLAASSPAPKPGMLTEAPAIHPGFGLPTQHQVTLAPPHLERPELTEALNQTSQAMAVPAAVAVRSRLAPRQPKPTSPAPSAKAVEQAQPAALNISARPVWASIRVDGVMRGSTPLVLQDLTPGVHSIEALPLGHGPVQSKQIALTAGAVERLEFQINPEGN